MQQDTQPPRTLTFGRHDDDGDDDHRRSRDLRASTTAVAAAMSTTTSGGPSFTTTNDQVQGVDELDIVKTDGTYLYVASSQAVSIIRAYPVNETSVVSTIGLPNFSSSESVSSLNAWRSSGRAW